jgi:acyl carrier protein
VLDDGMLAAQTPARFAAVMAPKAEGAWHLHRLTQQCDLDFFVAFSSAASLVGNPGQSNYAAANGFLDGLMQARHSQGLPGLSINWGPWAEVGMAAQLRSQMQRQGMSLIAPGQGRQLFRHLLSLPVAQIGVLPFQPKEPILHTPRPRSTNLRLGLEQIPVKAREAYLKEWIGQRVTSILGLTGSQPISVQQPLFELGVDSLMSLELRNQLAADLEMVLPATTLFNYPTIERLAVWLLSRLGLEVPKSIQAESTVLPQQQTVESKRKEISAELSAEELMALIEQEFTSTRRMRSSNE